MDTKELPNYIVPPYDGIGANEYIVDVTHLVSGPDGDMVPAVDFVATVDTPYVWELNIWYHTLNAGFRTRISGETDFPCIYGERVGLGRSYCKLDGALTFEVSSSILIYSLGQRMPSRRSPWSVCSVDSSVLVPEHC